MVVIESIENIKRTVAHLRREAAEAKLEYVPAVIAAPAWFVDKLRQLYNEPADAVVESIEGCQLTVRSDLEEPFTISAEGKLYPVLPGWARAANLGAAS